MRLVLFIQLAFLFCLIPIRQAAALDVPVRAGAHTDYSRLVFDWPRAVSYSTGRPDETHVDLSFDIEAGLDGSQLAQNPVASIKALSVLSVNPLHVRLDIDARSRVRDFTVGDRVIVDVYHPPGAKLDPRPLTVQEVPVPAVSVAVVEAVEESRPVAPPPPSPPDQAGLEAPGAAENVEKADETHTQAAVSPPEDDRTVQLHAKAVPTLVTLSSTRGFGFAAFEKDGRLWIVTDRDDPLVTPHISGPRASEFGAFEARKTGTGKAYIADMPQDLLLKGHGGGILWRVIAAPDVVLKEPVLPVRTDVDVRQVRGGRLMWPLKTARKLLAVPDEVTGEIVYAVTVGEADDFSGPMQEFVDFSVLRSAVGLAVVPKVDDLKVEVIRGGVEISRGGAGLALSDEEWAQAVRHSAGEDRYALHDEATALAAGEKTAEKIFDFQGWRMGGLRALPENRRLILSKLKDLTPSERAEKLMFLGKAYLANMMGPEAMGLFRLARQDFPAVGKTPEFLALSGVAKALSGKSADAFADLSGKDLKPFPEIGLWKAYVLADLGDWQQAAEVLPADVPGVLRTYPSGMRSRLALSAAEVYLRAGEVEKADALLHTVEQAPKGVGSAMRPALLYLKGETARQKKDFDGTEKYWKILLRGDDPLYRVRAGLALTRLFLDLKKVSLRRAIDKLESLRYAWRGDDIEAQVNYWLGQLYFQAGDYVKGLNIMRDATTYTSTPTLSHRIAGDMRNTFLDLFEDEKLKSVSALDAVTLYEQFAELVPPDARGNSVVEKLAEHLVKADLLGRAGDLLAHQAYHRLEGYEAFRVALRLAAVRLIDERPGDAMEAVEFADKTLKTLPEELRSEKNTRLLALLRARTMSRQGRPDQALAMLIEMEPVPEVNRLRADIAWKASYWDDAAEALNDVILDQNISLTRPLSPEHTALLLQRAVALNLAGDRVALAKMRERYAQSMAQTDKAKIFDVISRPRQTITLSDRETLLSIVSEVDLFASVLDDLKKGVN